MGRNRQGNDTADSPEGRDIWFGRRLLDRLRDYGIALSVSPEVLPAYQWIERFLCLLPQLFRLVCVGFRKSCGYVGEGM